MVTTRLVLSLAALALSSAALARPVLSVSLKQEQLGGYIERVRPLLDMPEADVLALIPEKSGLYFCDCVHCDLGRQEGQFAHESGSEFVPWSVEEPDVLRCKHCGHEYPSDEYPENGALAVINPRGEAQVYPYYEDADGYKHHFAARLDYHKIRYMEQSANTLARIYALTEEPRYARLAGVIMGRFAEVHPGYCYHFDCPFREKVIYDGDVDPKDFRSGFRTARWSWWAYMDIPDLLVEAYDLVAASGELERLGTDVAPDIEAFLTTASEQVLANNDTLSNMAPGMWADAIAAGRVLGKPEYIHTAVGRLRRLMTGQFFYDGVWKEGAPSYHSQVNGNLSYVFKAARGYTDPGGYTYPETGERFDGLDIGADLPLAGQSEAALMQMRLPNGRFVPVHDTWSTNGRGPLEESTSYLLPGLGHACLGRGEGDAQTQVHLTWSGGYGHTHYDGLSMLLFAHGKELLSDLGYTHTKGRAWTICTPSHNLVVVDALSQKAGGGEQCTLGSLRYFDASNDRCQVVSADNPEVYLGVVTQYRRTLALVAIDDESSYVVDLFQVQGGTQHDYFLHGSADEPQRLVSYGQWPPLARLLPEGSDFVPAQNEGDAGRAVIQWCPYGTLLQPLLGTGSPRRLPGSCPPV